MYPGTFVEASKKHLPDTPLNCNLLIGSVGFLHSAIANSQQYVNIMYRYADTRASRYPIDLVCYCEDDRSQSRRCAAYGSG